MAHVQVIQRNAHLAGPVQVEFVEGREGRVARSVLTAISNTRYGPIEIRKEQATAIQWTVWGRFAQYAAAYLARGSHVNIVGRLRNNHYKDARGVDVYAFEFTADEIDFLDTCAKADERREREAARRQAPVQAPSVA